MSEILSQHKCYFLIHRYCRLLDISFSVTFFPVIKSIASLTCVSASGDRARCFGIRSHNSFVKVGLWCSLMYTTSSALLSLENLI